MPTVRYTVIDGEVIAEKRSGVRREYVPDPLGSTVALLDSAQAKTDTFAYWPYGEEASRTGTTATPFRFVGTTGYYRDAATKNYVRARYLDSKQARWMTEDLINYKDAVNLYAYCSNSPIRLSDPSGLEAIIDSNCGGFNDLRIKFALKEACARVNVITDPTVKECFIKRCHSVIIVCHGKSDRACTTDTNAYTPWDIGQPKPRTTPFRGEPRYYFILCPGAFETQANPCLGQTLFHEMLHTCGIKDEATCENKANLAFPPDSKFCTRRNYVGR